jgi:CRISPR-associated endoribonuclease Cas6
MIAALILNLRLDKADPNSRHICTPIEAQKTFLNLVGTVNPTLEQHFRTDNKPKPYGLALGDGWLRVCLTDPAIYAELSGMLYALNGSRLTLGERTFRVLDAKHDQHLWAGLTSHTQLLQNASSSSKVTLDFKRATTFSRGEHHYPIPEPRLVFKGLLEKWSAHSMIPIQPEFLEWVIKHVNVTQLEGRTVVETGNYKPTVGFKGTVTYEAQDKDSEYIRYFQALAHFAFYAGVGYRTTLGMGLTRTLESPISHNRATLTKRNQITA